MLKGIHEVTYFVPDVHAALQWLQSLTGAELLLQSPDLIQARIGPSLVTFHPADEKAPPGPGGQVAYWRVDDLESALAVFEERGGHRYRRLVVGPDGLAVAQVQDPWGNVWGLIQAVQPKEVM